MTLFEVNQAAAIIKETAHPDVNLIFGAVLDPAMGEEIRVTVIATGFDRPSGIRVPQVQVANSERRNKSEEPQSNQRPSYPVERSERVPSPQPVQSSFESRVINTDDLDVPPFLRNHSNKQR
jgi:cell division protein FtsZ